jgi:hypothetical protein
MHDKNSGSQLPAHDAYAATAHYAQASCLQATGAQHFFSHSHSHRRRRQIAGRSQARDEEGRRRRAAKCSCGMQLLQRWEQTTVRAHPARTHGSGLRLRSGGCPWSMRSAAARAGGEGGLRVCVVRRGREGVCEGTGQRDAGRERRSSALSHPAQRLGLGARGGGNAGRTARQQAPLRGRGGS